jgi:hypothetical protein
MQHCKNVKLLALTLADGIAQLGSISGNGANIYYDPANPANAYLADQSYGLNGGGEIAPVPDPDGWLLIAIGGTSLVRRRRGDDRGAPFATS